MSRSTARKIAGLLLGFAGIVVVSAGAFRGHASLLGVGYAVTGALVWALGTIAFKRYAGQVDAWWGVGLPFLVGGVRADRRRRRRRGHRRRLVR